MAVVRRFRTDADAQPARIETTRSFIGAVSIHRYPVRLTFQPSGKIRAISLLSERLSVYILNDIFNTQEDQVALSIRNSRAEKLVREVAAETGESLTEAIIHALEERLERLKGRRMTTNLAEEIMRTSRRCRALPEIDPRSADEILGYEERGLPQ